MESQNYGASPAIWDHTVLPATRPRRACPALTPAMQAGSPVLDLLTPEGWKAEFTLLLGNAAAGIRTRDLSVPNPTL